MCFYCHIALYNLCLEKHFLNEFWMWLLTNICLNGLHPEITRSPACLSWTPKKKKKCTVHALRKNCCEGWMRLDWIFFVDTASSLAAPVSHFCCSRFKHWSICSLLFCLNGNTPRRQNQIKYVAWLLVVALRVGHSNGLKFGGTQVRYEPGMNRINRILFVLFLFILKSFFQILLCLNLWFGTMVIWL